MRILTPEKVVVNLSPEHPYHSPVIPLLNLATIDSGPLRTQEPPKKPCLTIRTPSDKSPAVKKKAVKKKKSVNKYVTNYNKSFRFNSKILSPITPETTQIARITRNKPMMPEGKDE